MWGMRGTLTIVETLETFLRLFTVILVRRPTLVIFLETRRRVSLLHGIDGANIYDMFKIYAFCKIDKEFFFFFTLDFITV